MGGQDKKISVIIPTRNAEQGLRHLLQSLQLQSIMPDQIIVVDSSSKDATEEICNGFGVEFIRIDEEQFDHGGTRRLAAARAIGRILVFLTQDVIFKDTDCFRNLIKPLDRPEIAASHGRQIPRENADPIEKFTRYFNYPSYEIIKGINELPKLGVKTFFFSNVCSAIKKSAYEEVGGFPERTIMNEDMFLAAKLIQKGYKIAYQPDAAVYHSHHYFLGIQFKRYFDIGVFFSRNRWIKDLVSSEKEGIRYFKEEIRYLLTQGEQGWIPYALADTAVRFLGYRMGLIERILPVYLKKKISFHKRFWERDTQ